MIVDTGIFIEHIRAKDKYSSTLFQITKSTSPLYISSVSLYELYIGAATKEKEYEIRFLTDTFTTLSFTEEISIKAAKLQQQLKRQNKLIEFRDIFISATCIVNNLPLLTLNKKHFERVDGLSLI